MSTINDIKEAIRAKNIPICCTIDGFDIIVGEAEEKGFVELDISNEDMLLYLNQKYRFIEDDIDDLDLLADIIAKDIESVMRDLLI